MRIRRHQLNPQGLRAADLKEDESLLLSATLSSATAGVDANLSHEPVSTSSEYTGPGDVSMIMLASNYSPSVNWLDRLRAAKGFPRVDPNIDIGDFLSSAVELGCAVDEHAAAVERGCSDPLDAAAFLKQHSLNSSHILQAGCNGSSQKHGMSAGVSSFPTPCACDGTTGVGAESESGSHSHISGHSNISVTDERSQNRSSSSSKEGNNIGERFLPTPHQNEDGVALKKSGSSCHNSKEGTGISQLYFDMFTDLFCMEVRSLGSSPSMETGKKQQRKQENPKPCSNFTDADPRYDVVTSSQFQTHQFPTHETNASTPISQPKEVPEEKSDVPHEHPKIEVKGEASVQQKKSSNTNNKKKDTIDQEEERSVKNEILVIDTSLTDWKVEKVIFRKGKGWKINNKGVPAKDGTAECSARIANDQERAQEVSNFRREVPIKVQRDQDLIGACKEKSNEGSRTMEGLNSIQQHVIKVWKTPHTHARSSRKRKRSELVGDEPLQENIELRHLPREPGPSEKAANFAFDHPANQPKEGLFHSIYQVFTQAGRAGLTAREAVSRILEQGLPGLQEGGVAPRVEVLKIVSNSPYFMPLEESKYILCSALVGDEEPHQDLQNRCEPSEDDNRNDCSDIVKPVKQHGVSQYWAACTAIRRARTGITRRKPSPESSLVNTSASHDAHQVIAELASKKRLKSVKQDSTGLGNRCNRSDGKGWHCPLRANVGYLLCDHHLDRLRTRVKSHIKSRVLSITKASKGREHRLGGSWATKTGVDRSRIAKHPKGADDNIEAQHNSCMLDL